MLKLFVFQLSFPHMLVCCCFHYTTCYISKMPFVCLNTKLLVCAGKYTVIPFEPVQGSKKNENLDMQSMKFPKDLDIVFFVLFF